jgi:hypothetical protein
MKSPRTLRLAVLLAALVGPLVAAVVTAAPATASGVPDIDGSGAGTAKVVITHLQPRAGIDCYGFSSAAKQSNGTVNLNWEIYCPSNYYFRINLAPVLVNLDNNNTTYYQKACASNNGVNDCTFRKNIPNGAGTHRWRLMWDTSWNGAAVYASNGDRWICNSPSGIYCGISNATW